MADDRERKAAEAKFKKSERATEGAQAMSEYSAERQAERAKTARLKNCDWPKRRPTKKPNRSPRRKNYPAPARPVVQGRD
jgi:hypothetical protein